jgi:hypothetical protein
MVPKFPLHNRLLCNQLQFPSNAAQFSAFVNAALDSVMAVGFRKMHAAVFAPCTRSEKPRMDANKKKAG